MKLYTRVHATLALAALAGACGRAERAPADKPAAVGTQAGEVVLGPNSPKLQYISVVPVTLRRDRVAAVLPAQLVVNEDHTVRVFSPVTGRITELLAEPGSTVARGAPLARIASPDAAQASSDYARAAAASAQADEALRRAQDLYIHHVIALKDLESARSDQAQARAELERARSHAGLLGTGTTANGDFILRAPIAGQVLDRSANPGEEVRPDSPTPLLTISDIRTLWLTASIPQRDLPYVSRGGGLAFTTDAMPGRSLVGTITYVSDALDPQTRTATLRAVFANRDHKLRPMTFGEARLLVANTSGAAVLTVPTRALVTRGPTTVVFVETTPGTFQRRAVTVADDDGVDAVISSGLRDGERVVDRGSLLLASETQQ